MKLEQAKSKAIAARAAPEFDTKRRIYVSLRREPPS
jgi:hypothetical protein